jgi:hypothetical protein
MGEMGVSDVKANGRREEEENRETTTLQDLLVKSVCPDESALENQQCDFGRPILTA